VVGGWGNGVEKEEEKLCKDRKRREPSGRRVRDPEDTISEKTHTLLHTLPGGDVGRIGKWFWWSSRRVYKGLGRWPAVVRRFPQAAKICLGRGGRARKISRQRFKRKGKRKNGEPGVKKI